MFGNSESVSVSAAPASYYSNMLIQSCQAKNLSNFICYIFQISQLGDVIFLEF